MAWTIQSHGRLEGSRFVESKLTGADSLVRIPIGLWLDRWQAIFSPAAGLCTEAERFKKCFEEI